MLRRSSTVLSPAQCLALACFENLQERQSHFSAIFLTGRSGSGKSTLLNEFLTAYKGNIYGYLTLRHRSRTKAEHAFQHIYLPAELIPQNPTIVYDADIPQDLDYFIYRKADRVNFDRAAFLKLAEYLKPEQVRLSRPDLMVWDELGGEELLIDSFYQTALYWLDNSAEIPQIIIWKKQKMKSRIRRASLSIEEEQLLEKRRSELLEHPAVYCRDLDQDEQKAETLRESK